MLTERKIIIINKREKIYFTVPNPAFGIEKANGAGFGVFSGDAVVVGILKLKPVDGTESLVAVVVVVGFEKENNGKDELVVAGGGAVVVVITGVGRNWNEGVVDWTELLGLFIIGSFNDDDFSVLFLSNKESKSWRASAS